MLIVWNERAGRGRHRRSLCPWRACVSLGWGVCLPTLPHRDQPENLSSLRHAFLRKINLNSCIQHHFIQVWWRLGPHPLGGRCQSSGTWATPSPAQGPTLTPHQVFLTHQIGSHAVGTGRFHLKGRRALQLLLLRKLPFLGRPPLSSVPWEEGTHLPVPVATEPHPLRV